MIRANGCVPYVAGGCPDDQFCMPTNAIGTDGECGIDGAALGETCANADALYCGGTGQPGVCWDDDGDAGPLESICIPFASAASQCVAPRTAGYVAYKASADRSTLFCIPPP